MDFHESGFDGLELMTLRRFLAIAETGSINAAAQKLHMAQPPLSRQMRQLENRLGLPLFERGKRTVRLTEAGKLLQQRAGQLLGLAGNTIKELRAVDQGLQGTLRIGTVTSSGIALLPKVVYAFRNRYPGIRFQVWEGETNRIIGLLNEGALEIGLVRYPFDTKTYEAIKMPNEPLVVALHQSHRQEWGRRADEIDVGELAGMPLMIHRKYEAILMDHCARAGFIPEVVCMSDDVTSILSWAEVDVGAAIVPRAAIGLIPRVNLVFKTIINPLIETAAAAVWVRNRQLSVAAANFLDMFTRIVFP